MFRNRFTRRYIALYAPVPTKFVDVDDFACNNLWVEKALFKYAPAKGSFQLRMLGALLWRWSRRTQQTVEPGYYEVRIKSNFFDGHIVDLKKL